MHELFYWDQDCKKHTGKVIIFYHSQNKVRYKKTNKNSYSLCLNIMIQNSEKNSVV
jgi:hypothetical protein